MNSVDCMFCGLYVRLLKEWCSKTKGHLVNLKMKIYNHWWSRGGSLHNEFCFLGQRKLPVSHRKRFFLFWSVVTCHQNELLCVRGKQDWITVILAAMCVCVVLLDHKGEVQAVTWIFYFVCRNWWSLLCVWSTVPLYTWSWLIILSGNPKACRASEVTRE